MTAGSSWELGSFWWAVHGSWCGLKGLVPDAVCNRGGGGGGDSGGGGGGGGGGGCSGGGSLVAAVVVVVVVVVKASLITGTTEARTYKPVRIPHAFYS